MIPREERAVPSVWPPRLTARQTDVLRRVAEGATYPALAREWGIDPVTVRSYAHRARRALGAVSMAHAVLLACRAGLLDGRPRRHGDHAGFAAHVYRGEDPRECPLGCWEGEQEYRAERRAARAAAAGGGSGCRVSAGRTRTGQ